MIWPWIIAAVVITLILFEFVTWMKRRRMPLEELEAAVDEAAVEEQLAELARAQMKIAMLESHIAELQETNAVLQDGNEVLQHTSETQSQKLQARYREQLDQMELAYQRQMVMLSDRLALQGGAPAEGIRARRGPKEYEVRLANEVDRWLSRFEDGDQPQRPGSDGGTSGEIAAVAAEVAVQAAPEEPQAGAQEAWQNGAYEAPGEPAEVDIDDIAWDDGDQAEYDYEFDEDDGLSAQPAYGLDGDEQADLSPIFEEDGAISLVAQTPAESEEWEALNVDLKNDALYSPDGTTDETVALHTAAQADISISADAQAADLELLTAIRLLENLPEEHLDAPESEDNAHLGVKVAIKNTVEAPIDGELGYDYERSEAAAAVDESTEVDYESETNGRKEEALPDLAAVFGSDGWSERRVRAMQRALSRRLGSELDADYLDEDEFLRELDIDQHALVAAALTSEKLEDIMSSDDWVSDPIEELANYIRRKGLGLTPEAQENGGHNNGSGGHNGSNGAPEELNIWDAMVRDDANAARENGGVKKNGGAPEAANGDIVDYVEAIEAIEAIEEIEEISEPLDVISDAPQNGADAGSEELPASPIQEAEDDEEISATVAAILARAPESDEEPAPDFMSEYLPGITPQNGDALNGTAYRAENGTTAESDSRVEMGSGLDDLFAEPEEEVRRVAAPAVAAEPDVPYQVDLSVYEQDIEDVEQEAEAAAAEPPLDWEREPIIWQAEYYNNTRLADGPTVVRQDRDINFRWRDRAPAQGVLPCTFSVRWTGTLMLEPGQYRFTTSAPDGIRLWLNDRLVISAWYDQSEQTYQRDFTWHGGPLDVRVEHYENGGNARARFTWERTA